MTIREALLAMGYREAKPGQWIKPIGYQALSYHEGRNEWANWFLSGKGKIECWEIKKFKLTEEDGFYEYLRQLKDFECWTRVDLFIYGQSTFELSGIDL